MSWSLTAVSSKIQGITSQKKERKKISVTAHEGWRVGGVEE